MKKKEIMLSNYNFVKCYRLKKKAENAAMDHLTFFHIHSHIHLFIQS